MRGERREGVIFLCRVSYLLVVTDMHAQAGVDCTGNRNRQVRTWTAHSRRKGAGD
jgi:hypothetical protein